MLDGSRNLLQNRIDLDSASGTVQAFSDMTDAASLMLDTTSVIFSHTGDGTKTSLGALTDAGNGIASLSSALSGTTDAVSQALSDGETYYSSVSSTIQTALDAYSTDADAAFTSLNAVEICFRIGSITRLRFGFAFFIAVKESARDVYPSMTVCILFETALREVKAASASVL